MCLLVVFLLAVGKHMFFFIFLWHDPGMTPRAKVVINQLRWEKKLLQTEIKEMRKIRDKSDRNCEEDE